MVKPCPKELKCDVEVNFFFDSLFYQCIISNCAAL